VHTSSDEYPIGVLERLGIFGPEANGGRDYFTYIKNSPIKCWYMTGETIETFEDIVVRIRMPIIALNRCRNGASSAKTKNSKIEHYKSTFIGANLAS